MASNIDTLIAIIHDRVLGTADRLIGDIEPKLADVEFELLTQQARLNKLGTVSPDLALPSKFSTWEDNGYITSPKLQKNSDCWAFATAAAAEIAYQVAVGQKTESINLAEQDVIDCSNFGTAHAGGTCAFKWVVSRGVASESDAPYQGSDFACLIPVHPVYAGLQSGYVKNVNGYPSVEDINRAIIDHGPLYVSILATEKLARYRNTTGVFTHFHDYEGATNHAVVIVGWDDDVKASGDADGNRDSGCWRVRNSWGSGWGKNGLGWIRWKENGIGKWARWIEMDPVLREVQGWGDAAPIQPHLRRSLEG